MRCLPQRGDHPRAGGITLRFTRRRKKTSVLIVDDDPDICVVIRGLLEGGPYGEIWEATDGGDALDLAYLHQPDVIVLDYKVPLFDGQALSKGFRVLAPAARVLVLSGVLDSAPEWGDAFLRKTDIRRLRRTLDALSGEAST